VTDNINLDVNLVIPGDLMAQYTNQHGLPTNQRRLSALERCVARSKHLVSTKRHFHELLFGLFSVAVSQENRQFTSDLPIGALSYHLQQPVNTEYWYMRADPVYIMPNRDHLQLLGNSGLELLQDEAEQIIEQINQCFSDTDWTLRFITPRQWVLEQASPILLSTHTLFDAIGGNMHDHLPTGSDASRWRSLMNELQMFLFNLPLNRQREIRGLPTVNSLWFWGVGKLPEDTGKNYSSEYVQCWSCNPMALALAKLRAIPRCELPVHGDTWLKQVVTPGRQLLVFDEFDRSIAGIDPDYGWNLLKDFEQCWMQPFMTALQKGKINSITLSTNGGRSYYLTGAMNKRWWKRSKLSI